jgi:hypothetical protein
MIINNSANQKIIENYLQHVSQYRTIYVIRDDQQFRYKELIYITLLCDGYDQVLTTSLIQSLANFTLLLICNNQLKTNNSCTV